MPTWAGQIEAARVNELRAVVSRRRLLLDEAASRAWSFKPDGTPELARIMFNDSLPPLVIYADGTLGGTYAARVEAGQIGGYSCADLQQWYFTRHLKQRHPLIYRLFQFYEWVLNLFIV